MIPDNNPRPCALACCADSKAECARPSNLRQHRQLHLGARVVAEYTPGPTLIDDNMPFFFAKLIIDGQLARLEPYTNPSDAK